MKRYGVRRGVLSSVSANMLALQYILFGKKGRLGRCISGVHFGFEHGVDACVKGGGGGIGGPVIIC